MLSLRGLPLSEHIPFTPKFFMTSCWVLCGFLCLWVKASVLQCWLSEDQELVQHCKALEYYLPCSHWGWAGVSKCTELALPFTDHVMLGVAHMQRGSDWARLLHCCCLSTLHFHFLFQWWSSWTSMFLPMYYSLTIWKDYLNSQRTRYIELFFPHWCFVF